MTTAQAKYQAHQAAIRALIQQLEGSLEQHQTKAQANRGNWGYVGDIGHIERGLNELVGFMVAS